MKGKPIYLTDRDAENIGKKILRRLSSFSSNYVDYGIGTYRENPFAHISIVRRANARIASERGEMPPAENSRLTFVAIGDLPYNTSQEFGLGIISDAIAEIEPSFLIHYGDFQVGRPDCTQEELYEKKRHVIYGLTSAPVFYTPGDNDWTDCDRHRDNPRSELDALSELRREFFSPDNFKPVPKDWNYEAQGRVRDGAVEGYPENALWSVNGYLFVTIHVVATANGHIEILKDSREHALATARKRERAVEQWLTKAIEEANNEKVKAVVIAMQADPTVQIEEEYKKECENDEPEGCDVFRALLDSLGEKTASLNPSKPVLLIHGDTSEFCMESNFQNVESFWRLNSTGDYSVVDAAEITIDLRDERKPFKIRGLTSNSLPGPCGR